MDNQKQNHQSIILDGIDHLGHHKKTALPFLGIVFFVTLFISTAMISWITVPASLLDYGQSFLWAILFSNVILFIVAFAYHHFDEQHH